MSSSETDPTMLTEYDFSNAVRGNPRQYLAQRSRKGLHSSSRNEHSGSQDSVCQDPVVQIKTVEITKATVTSDRTLTVQLPDTIDAGEYQITLLIHEHKHS